MSKRPSMPLTLNGSLILMRLARLGTYDSRPRPLRMNLPVPSYIRTRARELLRRPVAMATGLPSVRNGRCGGVGASASSAASGAAIGSASSAAITSAGPTAASSGAASAMTSSAASGSVVSGASVAGLSSVTSSAPSGGLASSAISRPPFECSTRAAWAAGMHAGARVLCIPSLW